MNKSTIIALGIGFIVGISVSWGYFAQNVNELAPLQQSHVNVAQNNEQASVDKATEKSVSVVQPKAQSLVNDEHNIVAVEIETQSVDELPLEEQVTQLKLQLAMQKSLMENVVKKLRAPNDVEAALQAQFDEQLRNEEWAYQTETALQDFLLTADLPLMPDIVSAECKTSVCKFKLAAPTDNDSFDHTHWREINDKLMKQEFWLQFQRTTSTSNDSELTLLMTTEL